MERRSSTRKPAAKKSTTSKSTKAPATRSAPAKRARAKSAKEPAGPPPLRRTIFIDVENTSSEADLVRVLDHLKIDRTTQPTELTAVGNWRAVGARTARLLAGLGAHLVHSAPAIGVRDWSDLWIAVAAGRWLANARPGEVLEVVSDDRAFDAVGDSAATLGVVFRRTSYRSVPAAAERAVGTEPARRRRRRSGRRGSGRAPVHAPDVSAPLAAAPPPAPAPRPHAAADEEAHAASQEQIRAALARLTGGDATRWISLDTLANRLKAEGFIRPPGSPRLVVRLRRIKNVEVTPNGLVRLLEGAAEAPSESITTPAQSTTPRPRRRGGRRRRHRSEANDSAVPETASTTES